MIKRPRRELTELERWIKSHNFTSAEAAKALGVTKTTIQNWKNRGLTPLARLALLGYDMRELIRGQKNALEIGV